VIRSGATPAVRPLPSSGYRDCSDRYAYGSVAAYVCDLMDESWEDYLDEMGVRDQMISAIRNAPVQRIGVLRGLEVKHDDRGEGHGNRMLTNLLDSFEDLGANVVFLFADMDEHNAFDLTDWYARFGFERVDNDRSAPCMMIAAPELMAEVRAVNGFNPVEEGELCAL